MKSTLEDNAPNFRTPKEHKQWLEGKPTRGELAVDFTRMHDGFIRATMRAEESRDAVEALVRMLVDAGVLSREEYDSRRELQTRFRSMLDDLNASVTMTEREKADAMVEWNREHPELAARGAYVRDVVEFVVNLPLAERVRYAMALHIPEDVAFRKGELAQTIEGGPQ